MCMSSVTYFRLQLNSTRFLKHCDVYSHINYATGAFSNHLKALRHFTKCGIVFGEFGYHSLRNLPLHRSIDCGVNSLEQTHPANNNDVNELSHRLMMGTECSGEVLPLHIWIISNCLTYFNPAGVVTKHTASFVVHCVPRHAAD